MDDMTERVDRICERVLEVLEARVLDDEAPQDVRGLVQCVQLLGELLKLREGKTGVLRVVMEGGIEEFAK